MTRPRHPPPPADADPDPESKYRFTWTSLGAHAYLYLAFFMFLDLWWGFSREISAEPMGQALVLAVLVAAPVIGLLLVIWNVKQGSRGSTLAVTLLTLWVTFYCTVLISKGVIRGLF